MNGILYTNKEIESKKAALRTVKDWEEFIYVRTKEPGQYVYIPYEAKRLGYCME